MADSNSNIPTNRKEARNQGLKIYKAASACKRKHITFKYVISGGCVDCAKIKGKEATKRQAERNFQKRVETKRKKKFEHSEWLRQKGAYKRQERLRQATPKWTDTEKIKEIYQNRPEGMHVDHIIPIAGENVSGLHVSWNLQYLDAEENIRKHNSFDENN